MKQNKSQVAIVKYLKVARKVYGAKITLESEFYSDSGWCYINLARRFPDGSIGTIGAANAYKAKEVLKMAEELGKRVREVG